MKPAVITAILDLAIAFVENYSENDKKRKKYPHRSI